MSQSTHARRRARTLVVTLIGGTSLVASLFGAATAASAAPPDSWAAIGEITNSGTCTDNEATFTVSVPNLYVEAEMQGGFSINGTNANVEDYAVGVISPFSRSITVPVDTFPATFTVSYWLDTQAATLSVTEYTFGATCDSTPVAPSITSASLTPAADGTGVAYSVTVALGDAEGATVLIGHDDITDVTLPFTVSGTQTGSFPLPCGAYDFGVFFDGSTTGPAVAQSVTIPCANGTVPSSGDGSATSVASAAQQELAATGSDSVLTTVAGIGGGLLLTAGLLALGVARRTRRLS